LDNTDYVDFCEDYADFVLALCSIFEGATKRNFVGVAQVAAHRQSSRETGNFNRRVAVFYFFLVNTINSETRWRIALDTLVAVGGLTAVIFILKTVLRLDILSTWLPSAWNTVDSLNSTFGLWMIIIFLLSAGQIIRKDISAGRLLGCFFVSLLAMASLVLLSFQLLWWILLAGLVLLLLLGVSFIKEARLGWLSVLFAILIAVAVFIIFGSPRALQSTAIPAEVSLGMKPSWAITSNTLLFGVKNFLLGSGLGSFVVDFSQFRTVEFNNDAAAWSLRFSQPFSSLLGLAAEGGTLLFLTFVFLVLFVLGHVLLSWFRAHSEGGIQSLIESIGGSSLGLRLEVFLVALAWILVSIGSAFFFFGPALWWLWWLLLGLTVVGLSFLEENIIKIKKLTIEDTPQYNLSFSFLVIVIMAAIIMLGVWGVRLYLAETSYAEALRGSNYNVAESKLNEALSRRQNADVYHVALAQIYLAKAVEASRQPKPDIQTVSYLMAQAVNEAKRATDLSPRSAAIWANLATMYENAAVLVAEARDWAVKSLLEAKDLEPTNPVLYWRLGNNYALSGKWDEAIKAYQQAINLKKDYVGAYLGLANAYEQLKDLDKAVEVYSKMAGTNNAEVLFNYGRLLYNRNQRGDRAAAEKLWLEAARIMPNYSNVLYSLGLLYESWGDKPSALQYYYKVKDLNPDNKDIVTKIRALVGG